jgi:outer membrane protein
MEKRKVYNKKLKLVFWLMFYVGTFTVFGQNIPQVFTIETFISAVKENNHQAKIAEKEKLFKQQGKNESFAAFLPQVNFQGAYQRNFNDQNMYIEFPDFNNIDPATGEIPVTLQKFSVGFNNDFQANFIIEQNILSFKNIYELQTARVYSEIGELEYQNQMNEIISDARKMFLQTVLFKNVYELNQVTQENAHSNYISLKSKFENKLASEIDILQAKIAWENEIPNTIQARRNYLILLNNLKILSGLTPSDSIVLKYDFSEQNHAGNPFITPEIIESRIDYQLLVRNTELQKTLIKKEKSEYLPTLAGKFGYTYMCNSDQWKYDENVNKTVYAGLTLTIPIFSGGYRNAQVKKAKLQHDIANYKKEEAELNMTIEIQNLEMKLKEENSIINAAKTTLKTAHKAHNIALKNMGTGLISQLDLRRYSEDLKKAQLNLFLAIYNYECTLIDFNKAIGVNE